MSGTAVRLIAPAKINLALEVTGRRDDGYHSISTVITTIQLHDSVTISRAMPGSGVTVRLLGDTPGDLEADQELGHRAAQLVAEVANVRPDVEIDIVKRIPEAAGLGGGSSDAAAVIRGLNEFLSLGWSTERMVEIGQSIGSDVPFFISGGTALCEGRGEIVTELPDLRPLRMLVLVPRLAPLPGKTARRFGGLRRTDFSDGSRARRLAARIQRHAPPPTRDLVNVFEQVIERDDHELVAHYAAYAQAAGGTPRFHLAGAGNALFLFLFQDANAPRLTRDFERVGARVIETRTISRAEAVAIEQQPGEGSVAG